MRLPTAPGAAFENNTPEAPYGENPPCESLTAVRSKDVARCVREREGRRLESSQATEMSRAEDVLKKRGLLSILTKNEGLLCTYEECRTPDLAPGGAVGGKPNPVAAKGR